MNIIFGGDYSPVGRTQRLVKEGRFDQIFNDVLPEFEKADLSVLNLECTINDSQNSISKFGPSIKVDSESIRALEFLGVDIVALGNNHIMDYGDEGLEKTMDSCRQFGIEYLGAGKNIEEARTWIVKDVGSHRIAILNFAENEFSTTQGDYPGANPVDTVQNFYDIKSAKEEAEFVFVVFHGGVEEYRNPTPRMKKLFRFYIDSGASAVICSHAHCFSGYERYNNGLIFYGLGNFLFDWFVSDTIKVNTPWNYGYLVKFKIDLGLDFELIPYIQSSDFVGVKRLNDSEENFFYKEIESLNSIIADDKLLNDLFVSMCLKKNKFYKLALNPMFDKLYRLVLKINSNYFSFPFKKRLLLLNIIRCESHRDVLIQLLKEFSREKNFKK